MSIIVPTRRNYLLGVLVALVLVAILVVLLMTPQIDTTTTQKAGLPPPVRKAGSCIFWGDPHLVTFDGARPSFYGDGEYWIVKNPEVEIQGRYMGTKYTFGLAATQKVAISGSFIQNNVIEVEPMETEFGGRILVNGGQILPTYGQFQVGGATITYDGNGELIDEATSKWKKNIVHLDLPKGIRMMVQRWGNYLDLKIEMTQLPEGQDGSCGNFNGDASDDTTQAIYDRIGARINPGLSLFNDRANVRFTDEMGEMLKRQCPESDLAAAAQSCQQKLDAKLLADPDQLPSCEFDTCFGMNEHALRTAKTFATEEEREALGIH